MASFFTKRKRALCYNADNFCDDKIFLAPILLFLKVAAACDFIPCVCMCLMQIRTKFCCPKLEVFCLAGFLRNRIKVFKSLYEPHGIHVKEAAGHYQ
jgi:hypothetical protein